jgi:hypothetical protein
VPADATTAGEEIDTDLYVEYVEFQPRAGPASAQTTHEQACTDDQKADAAGADDADAAAAPAALALDDEPRAAERVSPADSLRLHLQLLPARSPCGSDAVRACIAWL